MKRNDIELITTFNRIIGKTLRFSENPFPFGYEEWRKTIENELRETVERNDGVIDPREYDDARFAIIAWIDEVVLNSSWIHRETWRSATLQERYYNTANAGEEFYYRLDTIKDDNVGLLTIYLTCLLLGFRGRYCRSADKPLIERIISAIKNRIASRESNIESTNSVIEKIHVYEYDKSRRVKFLKVASLFVVITLFVFTSISLNEKYKTLIIKLLEI